MSALPVKNSPFEVVQFAQTVPVHFGSGVVPLFGIASKPEDTVKLTGTLEKDFPWTKEVKPLKLTWVNLEDFFYKKAKVEELEKAQEVNDKAISEIETQKIKKSEGLREQIAKLEKQQFEETSNDKKEKIKINIQKLEKTLSDNENDPSYKAKIKELENKNNKIEKSYTGTILLAAVRTGIRYLRTKAYIKRKSHKYLPKEFRKRVFWYKVKKHFWVNLFGSKDAKKKSKCQLLTLQGPIAIKLKQAHFQSLRTEAEEFEKNYIKFKTDKAYRKETLKEAKENSRGLLKVFSGTIYKIKMGFDKRKYISDTLDYKSLLNDVPSVDFSQVETKVKSAIDAHNKAIDEQKKPAGLKIKLENVQKKAIKSGSVGQVHVATANDGKTKIIIKVTRPDVKDSILDECNKYLYIENMANYGTAKDRLYIAAREANNQVQLIKDEIDFRIEASHYEKLKNIIDNVLKLKNIEVPEIYGKTKDAMTMEFVGTNDLNDLEPISRKEYIQKATPDLIKLISLSPFKNIDIHDGNIRVNTETKQVYLIDCGRSAELDEKINKAILKLYVLNGFKRLENIPDIETINTVEIISGNEAKLTTAIKKIRNDIQKYSTMKKDEDRNHEEYQKLENALERNSDVILIQNFLKSLLELKSIEVSDKKNKRTTYALNQEKKHGSKQSTANYIWSTTLLSTWANFINTRIEYNNLPSLSKKPIATTELKYIKNKYNGVLKMFLNSEHYSKEEQELLTQQNLDKNYAFKISDIEKDIAEDKLRYIRNKRIEPIISNITDALLEESEMPEIKNDPSKYEALKSHIKKSLLQELPITESKYY